MTNEYRLTLINTLYILSCENITDELVIDERWKTVTTLTDKQLLLIDTLFLDKDWINYPALEIISKNKERFYKHWGVKSY